MHFSMILGDTAQLMLQTISSKGIKEWDYHGKTNTGYVPILLVLHHAGRGSSFGRYAICE